MDKIRPDFYDPMWINRDIFRVAILPNFNEMVKDNCCPPNIIEHDYVEFKRGRYDWEIEL